MIPQCAFCKQLAATPSQSHIALVESKHDDHYLPCCLSCLKQRKARVVRLVRIPGLGGDPKRCA